MSEFKGTEYRTKELIRTCGFEADICRFINGLDWQELFLKSSNEIQNYKEALILIRDAEVEAMKCQRHLIHKIIENDIFGLKSDSQGLNSEIRKRYGLLQLKDILNKDNIGVFLKNLQNENFDAPSNSSSELKLETVRKNAKPSRICDIHVRKSISKLENANTIMIAEPASLQFRNFKLQKSYKKIVLLKNVSLNLARLQLEEMKKTSRLSVFLEFMKSQKGTIAPGMFVKLIVVFRCNSVDETEENIVVRVRGGRSIIIPVHAFRDPPILHGVSTLYHSCFRSDSIITPSTNSLNTTLVESEIWTGDEEVLQMRNIGSSASTETSEYANSSNGRISTAYFECGKSFIGELVIIPTTMKNAGGNGRFFIITEVDWSSMNIEDVANSNMVLSPPFAVHPAYFILRANEEITFHSYFFPSTYGMQVDKFFVISDNCSVQPIEIIGDGIMYEEKFILFNEKLKKEFEYEVCEDKFAKYCVELDHKKSDEILYNMIEIFNTSGMILHYRWEQRNVKAKNEETKWKDSSFDDIIIYPKFGVFKPYSSSTFYIFAKTEYLVSDQYRTILQLCIEDIPLASIHKKFDLRVKDSKIKRRMCQVTMDIFVFDIEIRIDNFFFDSSGSSDRILELDKSIQTSREDYLVSTPVSEKQRITESMTSEITSFDEPSCSETMENALTLKAECIVEPPNVSFFFSLRNIEIWVPNEELICVEWNSMSDKTTTDAKLVTYSDILPKEKEEKSFWSEESELSESEFDADSLEEIASNFSNELFYQNTSRALIPFQKRIFSLTQQPVIEFLKLSLKVVEKRIFLIQNNTSLISGFSLRLKNFCPVDIDDRELIDKNWNQIQPPDSGVILITKPIIGILGPFEIKSIEVYAYSDTWGDYEDEISINIDGLPSFQISVQIQVEDLPVSYPVCRNLVRKTPILKFMKYDLSSTSRTLAIENTSSIPIVINWHLFLKEDDPFLKLIPFKVMLDIFTTVSTFEFSEKSNFEKENNVEQLLKTPLERYKSNQSFKELNCFDSMSLTPSCNSNKSFVDLDSARSFENIVTESLECINNSSEKMENETENGVTENIEYTNVEMIQKNQSEEEIELSIIPNYGKLDDKIFSIHPQELFIPPRTKRFTTVTFHPETPLKYSSKTHCQVLGFIRISPEYKSKSTCFLRKDGHSILPTVIDLEIINVRPYLSLLSSKSQKKFKCYANEFTYHLKPEITIERNLLLKNENQEELDVYFETNDPFYINRIITYCGTILSSSLCLKPGESIEIVVSCKININTIQEAIQSYNDWLKTVIRNLLIGYHDGWIQEIELCLQMYLPLVKLSTNSLSFECVKVGSSKELFLKIENFAVWDQVFEIKRESQKCEFSVVPTKGCLSSSKSNAGRSIKISISFIPTEEKFSREVLDITTGIPGYEIKCEVSGTGILDPAE